MKNVGIAGVGTNVEIQPDKQVDLRLETWCCQLEVSSGPNWRSCTALCCRRLTAHTILAARFWNLDTLEPVEVFSRHAMKHRIAIVQTRANDSRNYRKRIADLEAKPIGLCAFFRSLQQ